MQSIIWDTEDLGATFKYGDIPDDLKEKAAECAHRRTAPPSRACARGRAGARLPRPPSHPSPTRQARSPLCRYRYRSALVETAVDMDEDVMMAYLEGEEPDEATLKRLIRAGTIAGTPRRPFPPPPARSAAAAARGMLRATRRPAGAST